MNDGILPMLNLRDRPDHAFGASLFAGCRMGKTTIERTSRALHPLWPAMIAVLFLIPYVPWFAEYLLGLFMK